MVRIKIAVFLLIVSLLNINFLYAKYKKVTLNKCIKIAIQNHPEIKISLENRRKRVAGYKVAKAQNKILVNGEVKTVEYLKSGKDQNELNIPGRDTDFGWTHSSQQSN